MQVNCLLILIRSEPNDLFLVVGQIHDRRTPIASETPPCLTIPERARFTGTAIVGAIGTGKTSRCMCPFVEQILTYRATDEDKRIGGPVLEVIARRLLPQRPRNPEPPRQGLELGAIDSLIFEAFSERVPTTVGHPLPVGGNVLPRYRGPQRERSVPFGS